MFSLSFLAMMRAAVSAAPPAAKPTTMVIDFLGGKSCALAEKANKPLSKQRLRWRRVVWNMEAFMKCANRGILQTRCRAFDVFFAGIDAL